MLPRLPCVSFQKFYIANIVVPVNVSVFLEIVNMTVFGIYMTYSQCVRYFIIKFLHSLEKQSLKILNFEFWFNRSNRLDIYLRMN